MKRKKKTILLCIILALVVWTGLLYATTFKYLYAGDATYYETDAYGGGVGNLANDGAYDVNGADIDLETDGYYGVWITLEHDSAGTTDDIVLGYFASYDDGTNLDDVAMWEVTCVSDGSDDQQTFGMFPAPPHGKLGVKTNGTTDEFDYQITIHKVRGDGT